MAAAKRTPAEAVNPGKEAEANLYHEKQAAKKGAKEKPLEEYFKLSEDGQKVVKITKTKSGTHSVFVGTKKECDKNGIKYRV